MSFLLQRRSKAIVPTPDPPVRRLPDSGVIQASVLVVPPDGSVHETGMMYGEFDVESDSTLQMILSQYRIFGLVQVAEYNPSAIIIADIVCVPMKYVGRQVKPETWYLPTRDTWQYPIIRQHHARLLARLNVEVKHHSIMQSGDDYKHFTYQTVIQEDHRVFLVVHCLIGPYSRDMKIAMNISANVNYYKEGRLH
ncbi:hypothetical protein K443DRAFT_86805 [Laccaria amethystina LaAM-08-1]|uniref:Uncharacterized protein n=1 Tax=Laccaria amethystina LaAM-08-1 TaxID=1095629 RepID=A0A0C9YBC3_9AGAR|nr:hypothetical protein K443DRAFT_86805 [Laccaria amethystina LaAM-08-1]